MGSLSGDNSGVTHSTQQRLARNGKAATSNVVEIKIVRTECETLSGSFSIDGHHKSSNIDIINVVVGTRSATDNDAVLRDQDWLGVVDCRRRTTLMMSTFSDVK